MKNKHVSVKVKGDQIDRALKLFKKKTFSSGHLLELRDRQEFTKPSVKRREEKQKAIRRQKYENLNDNEL